MKLPVAPSAAARVDVGLVQSLDPGVRTGSVGPLLRALGWPGVVLAIFAACALVGPYVAPYDPLATDATAINLPPLSGAHVLGTDELGRDVLSRILTGARLTFFIGLTPVVVATVIGLFLGTVAAFGQRTVGFVVMRLTDVALAFPAIMLALAVAAILGPSVRNIIISITLVLIAPITRISRAAALDVAGRPYIDAARVSGASRARVIRDFALPNMVAPVMIYAATLCGLIIIYAAGLSFLGVGVQPPAAEWGRMVADGRGTFLLNPWPSLVPGAFIFVVSMAFNLAADRVRNHLDPRTA